MAKVNLPMITYTQPIPQNSFEMYRLDRMYYYKEKANIREIVVDISDPRANLVSSQIVGTTRHSPILDIDDPDKVRYFSSFLYVEGIPGLQIFPSSTNDHYHVYLNGIEITWPEYEVFLTEMRDLDIISQGYFQYSVARMATFLRPPWIKKFDGDPMPGYGEIPAPVPTAIRTWGGLS